MKVLVTGATGFIGLEVASQLATSPHDVRVLVRRPLRAPLVARLDAEVVHGDLTAPASIERAVEGVDAIIHLAGRATFERYDRLQPSLVDGTRTLAEAAARHGVSALAFGSSALVYPGTGAPIDRSTPSDPVIDYGRAKVDAEAILAEVGAAHDIAIASLRLPHVYGPQSLLFGMVRRRLLPFPGPGTNRFAQLHVVDAARALIAAVEQRWEGVAPIADHSGGTWNDFIDVLTLFSPRLRVVRIPEQLAAIGATVGGAALSRLGANMVTRDTVRGWNLELPIDLPEMWQELGIEPRFPTIQEGIPATLDGVVAFLWQHPVFDRS